MARVMNIGGNFQLAEQARMFQHLGVVYVQPRHAGRADLISEADNAYNVVVLNPDGDFDIERVVVEGALSLARHSTEDRKRFFGYAENPELQLISVGVSDGVLKNMPDAPIWSDLALFLHKMYTSPGRNREISVLSSDNAFNNGALLSRNILTAIATHPYEPYGHNPGFNRWFLSNVHFHSCVVDRMVIGKPGRAALDMLNEMSIDPHELTLYTEPSPRVSHKLVIEDPTGRLADLVDALPAHERAALTRTSILPYAAVKYEGANYFHTLQAHWGYIAGLEDVYTNLQHPVLGPYAMRSADAKAQIISKYGCFQDTSLDVARTIREFADRCHNPYLGHGNEFIVKNGTGKIVERVKRSLIATSGEVDNGMYGTIASIIREKTPVREEEKDGGVIYVGENDNGQEYTIEDTDRFIMKTMSGVDAATARSTINDKVGEILAHLGLDGLSPDLCRGIANLVSELYKKPAMKVLAERYSS